MSTEENGITEFQKHVPQISDSLVDIMQTGRPLTEEEEAECDRIISEAMRIGKPIAAKHKNGGRHGNTVGPRYIERGALRRGRSTGDV